MAKKLADQDEVLSDSFFTHCNKKLAYINVIFLIKLNNLKNEGSVGKFWARGSHSKI